MTKLIQSTLLAAALAGSFAASAQALPFDPLPGFRPVIAPALQPIQTPVLLAPPIAQPLTIYRVAPAPLPVRAQPARPAARAVLVR